MNRIKLLKALAAIFAATLSFICFKTDALAYTQYSDNNANDSIEDAQLIMRNTQTPTQYNSNISTSYKYVTGYIQSSDEDWYMVYLSSSDDDCLLDIRGGISNVTYEIYDSNGILLGSYVYNNGSVQVFDLYDENNNGINNIVLNDGYYYIRLSSSAVTSQYYHFTIGAPQYSRAVYSHVFENVPVSKSSPFEDSVTPAAEDTTIPDMSWAYEISISGVSSGISNQRYFRNQNTTGYVATNTAYMYHLGCTSSDDMDQEWGIRIVSSNTTTNTISPNLIIRYIKPER